MGKKQPAPPRGNRCPTSRSKKEQRRQNNTSPANLRRPFPQTMAFARLTISAWRSDRLCELSSPWRQNKFRIYKGSWGRKLAQTGTIQSLQRNSQKRRSKEGQGSLQARRGIALQTRRLTRPWRNSSVTGTVNCTTRFKMCFLQTRRPVSAAKAFSSLRPGSEQGNKLSLIRQLTSNLPWTSRNNPWIKRTV